MKMNKMTQTDRMTCQDASRITLFQVLSSACGCCPTCHEGHIRETWNAYREMIRTTEDGTEIFDLAKFMESVLEDFEGDNDLLHSVVFRYAP